MRTMLFLTTSAAALLASVSVASAQSLDKSVDQGAGTSAANNGSLATGDISLTKGDDTSTSTSTSTTSVDKSNGAGTSAAQNGSLAVGDVSVADTGNTSNSSTNDSNNSLAVNKNYDSNNQLSVDKSNHSTNDSNNSLAVNKSWTDNSTNDSGNSLAVNKTDDSYNTLTKDSNNTSTKSSAASAGTSAANNGGTAVGDVSVADTGNQSDSSTNNSNNTLNVTKDSNNQLAVTKDSNNTKDSYNTKDSNNSLAVDKSTNVSGGKSAVNGSGVAVGDVSVADSGNSSNTENKTINYNNQQDKSDHSVNDSYNTLAFDKSHGNVDNSNGSSFGDGAMVASSQLSNYVTGVKVMFGSAMGPNGSNNSLQMSGNSFQNFQGLQSQNVNTGAAASQNSNISMSVTTGNITR
jgi:hypothetical protein